VLAAWCRRTNAQQQAQQQQQQQGKPQAVVCAAAAPPQVKRRQAINICLSSQDKGPRHPPAAARCQLQQMQVQRHMQGHKGLCLHR
jgi:hypothetical protein